MGGRALPRKRRRPKRRNEGWEGHLRAIDDGAPWERGHRLKVLEQLEVLLSGVILFSGFRDIEEV